MVEMTQQWESMLLQKMQNWTNAQLQEHLTELKAGKAACNSGSPRLAEYDLCLQVLQRVMTGRGLVEASLRVTPTQLTVLEQLARGERLCLENNLGPSTFTSGSVWGCSLVTLLGLERRCLIEEIDHRRVGRGWVKTYRLTEIGKQVVAKKAALAHA